MEYKIADHIAAMKPSAIREIFKVLVDPTVISLAAGSPDPVSFPNKEMAKIGSEIFLNEADVALQYGFSTGYLRTFIWGTTSLRDGLITYGAMLAFIQLVGQIQTPVRTLTQFIPIFISVF